MRVHQIKFKGKSENYSILIGENILNLLSKKIIREVQKRTGWTTIPVKRGLFLLEGLRGGICP